MYPLRGCEPLENRFMYLKNYADIFEISTDVLKACLLYWIPSVSILLVSPLIIGKAILYPLRGSSEPLETALCIKKTMQTSLKHQPMF